MHIHVNDEEREVRAAVLTHVLDELGYGNAKVATAVDGIFIPTSRRAAHRLHEGARLEIVAPMQGG